VEAVPRVRQRIDMIDRASLRWRQLGCLRVVQAAPDVPARDSLHIISVDEAEASLRSDHDSVEDVEFRHFQHVLKSADLRARAAQHRRPAGRRLNEIGMSSVMPGSCLTTRQRGHLGPPDLKNISLAVARPAARVAMTLASRDPQPDPTISHVICHAIDGPDVHHAAQSVIQAAARVASYELPQAEVRARALKITNALKDAAPEAVAGAIETATFPGTSDIGVLPGTILQFTAPAAAWTIQAGDLVAVPGSTKPTDDVRISFPAHMVATGGAKITVTGTADIKVPRNAVISEPRQRDHPLPKDRWLLAPQGTNVIVANLGLIVIANIVTLFGIGAELGIACVLTSLSEATGPGRVGIYGVLAAFALLVLVYAKTATRALANPQPGSSTSAQAGTSFTL